MKEEKSISPQEYGEILKDLKLNNLYLKKGNFFVDRENFFKNEKIELKLTDEAKFKKIKDGTINVFHDFKLDAFNMHSKKKILSIECIFCLNFTSKKEFSSEFFEIFKDVNLPINSYPFFREFVFNATSRMNIPPLTIPLIKRFPKEED